MADRPLSNSELQKLLNQRDEDIDAVRKEFEEANTDNNELNHNNAKERVGKLAPDAYETLRHLVKFAESESVKLTAAKYILDIAIGKGLKPTDPDAAIKDLIDSLRPKADSNT